MSRCERFELEGLKRLEQGLPLDPHFDRCPDCLRVRAVHERLKLAIAEAAEETTPPAGWQDRVWDEIREGGAAAIEPEAGPDLRRRWTWFAAIASAAAIVLFLFIPQALHPDRAALSVEVDSSRLSSGRGNASPPGSLLKLRALTGGARFAELRVYLHGEKLVLRCSTEPPCVRGGQELSATVALSEPGRYRPMLIVDDRPLPEPIPDYDADTAAARSAGAELIPDDEIDVR